MFRALSILAFLLAGQEQFLHTYTALCIITFKASLSLGDETTPLPRCQNFECPDNSPEGGLWPDGDGCSGTFCECSYGVSVCKNFYSPHMCRTFIHNINAGIPYQLECEEANPPLFFNPAQEVCDWCFNMCDTCGSKCPACK